MVLLVLELRIWQNRIDWGLHRGLEYTWGHSLFYQLNFAVSAFGYGLAVNRRLVDAFEVDDGFRTQKVGVVTSCQTWGQDEGFIAVVHILVPEESWPGHDWPVRSQQPLCS